MTSLGCIHPLWAGRRWVPDGCVALVVMATRRALHFVFKVGNRFQTARFYRDVLGMQVGVAEGDRRARVARAAEPDRAGRGQR